MSAHEELKEKWSTFLSGETRNLVNRAIAEHEALMSFNMQVSKECGQLKTALEQSEKCCAEMRYVIQCFAESHDCSAKNMIDHAISSDCGKGYASPEQVRVLKDKTVESIRLLDWVIDGLQKNSLDAIPLIEHRKELQQALDMCKKLEEK